MDPIVVWFRRDLRLRDHPALTHALGSGTPLAPLFVVDPRLLTGRFASPNRSWFLAGSVEVLAAELKRHGSRLTIRFGNPVDVVPAFARELGASGVVVSRDYTPFGRARDRAVAEALGASNIAFHAKRGSLVHEPEELVTVEQRGYRVFTPFLRAWQGLVPRAALPLPDTIPTIRLTSDDDGIAELRSVAPTADPASMPAPGEPAARDRLEGWLKADAGHGPSAYARTRDRLADPRATSRLSQDLRFGLLSPVDVVHRTLDVAGDSEGARRFVSELAWRDFYAHALWHEPRIAREPFLTRYGDLIWPGGEAEANAWRTGRTGYPIVDAAMRQLVATGFMPNRARMITASFLAKDLLVDWRIGEAHFMHHLTDGDPASNLGGWQWAASVGTDAQPYVRVFNPVTQGERFDPGGDYVRTWIPELERVSDRRLHAPWAMSPSEQQAAGCQIGVDYPAPIVNHSDARLRAIALLEGSR